MDEIYMHEELTKMPLAKRDVLLQNPNISNKECFAFLLEIYLQYFSNSLWNVLKSFYELTLAFKNKLQNF